MTAENDVKFLKAALIEASENLARAGWKVAAVKAYRSATGCGLQTGIDYINKFIGKR